MAAGSALLAESTRNGYIDPGERVELALALRNIGVVNTTNLVATLMATNGVTLPAGSGSVSSNFYGAVTAGGSSVSKSFKFTAAGTNGGRLVVTLRLTEGSLNLGEVTFTYLLGKPVFDFANANPITVNDATPAGPSAATPFPSTITVSGVTGPLTKLVVQLNGISHRFPDDLDVILVGPNGLPVMLMSDAGGGNALNNVTLSLDDAAANFLPDAGVITNGAYRPTNYGLTDATVPPAPAGPYGSSLSLFNGMDPNGVWSLYVIDDNTLDGGAFAGGWSLSVSSSGSIPLVADLSIAGTDSPDPVVLGGNVTYTLTAQNHGPAAASGVVVTHEIPPGVAIVSASSPNGACAVGAGIVTCNLGALDSGGQATVTVVVTPAGLGTLTTIARVQASQTDLISENNTATVKTSVIEMMALTMGRQGSKLFFAWPAGATGFVLEYTESLQNPVWTPVTDPPIVFGAQKTVTIVPGAGARFYRLHQP